jgi:hypothetical protein
MGMDWQGQRAGLCCEVATAKFFAAASARCRGGEIHHALDDHQPISDALMHRLTLERRR